MKILLEAPILTQSGYGEHSRFIFRSLMANPDLQIYVNPLNWGATSWIHDDTEERRSVDSCIKKFSTYINSFQNQEVDPMSVFDMHIHVGIPNEFRKKAPYAICVTAGIETDRVSADWISRTRGEIDKLIVPSRHSKKVFEETSYEVINNNNNTREIISCGCPVEVVPYPIKVFQNSETLGLPLETKFNFLSVALLGPRKNIENMIHWFMEEFEDLPVGLVLKTGISRGSVMDREKTFAHLKNLISDKYSSAKCKVYLLHGNLSDCEIHSLYTDPNIHAYISATHGEGYGLPIFEAAYSGMPIVATNWSGHLDFLVSSDDSPGQQNDLFSKVSYTLEEVPREVVWENIIVEGSKWAIPNSESFKSQIRDVYEKYTNYKQRAMTLKKQIEKTHNSKAITKLLQSRIFRDSPYVLNHVNAVDEIPKISIITSVYKGKKYIEQFLQNITSQTIFKEKCELILINANSPEQEDEEKHILKYKSLYPDNIIYKKLDHDPGIYGVWNMAIAMSSGEYITNANLDDRKSKDSLEKHAIGLYNNEDIDLVYTDMLITDEINETWENNSSNGRKYNMPQYSLGALKMMNMPHAAPMWRKSLHDRYGEFDSSFRSAGDWEMWLRAASQGSEFKKLSGIHNLYCFNPTGVSTNPDNFSWKREEEKRVFQKYNKKAS